MFAIDIVLSSERYQLISLSEIRGPPHHVWEARLQRYAVEFDFRYNTRKISDADRTERALEGARGKRLTYRRTDEAAHA